MCCILVLAAVVMFILLSSRKKKLSIAVTTHDGVTIRGNKLMATINTNQKVKLTANVNGAVQDSTFEFSVATGESVTLERVEGELAVYAVAASVGSSVVELAILSSDGSRLAALAQVDVVEAPATELTITEGEPEPK